MLDVEHWAAGRSLPSHLKRDIRAYYSMVWSHSRQMHKEHEIMQELPYPLRCRAAINISTELRDAVPALAALHPAHFERLAARMLPCWYGPGRFLACPRGHCEALDYDEEALDSLYVVEKGKVACIWASSFETVTVLEGPCCVGAPVVVELLLESCCSEPAALERGAEHSLLTVAPTWVWRISKDALRAVLAANPGLGVELAHGLLEHGGGEGGAAEGARLRRALARAAGSPSSSFSGGGGGGGGGGGAAAGTDAVLELIGAEVRKNESEKKAAAAKGRGGG